MICDLGRDLGFWGFQCMQAVKKMLQKGGQGAQERGFRQDCALLIPFIHQYLAVPGLGFVLAMWDPGGGTLSVLNTRYPSVTLLCTSGAQNTKYQRMPDYVDLLQSKVHTTVTSGRTSSTSLSLLLLLLLLFLL